MTLRELYNKSKALIDMGHDPSSIVFAKPRELGDLFEVFEVSNLAPGLKNDEGHSHKIVLVEFREHKNALFDEASLQHAH